MGMIVVTEFVSLDGVMQDPGGAEDYKHAGWTFEFERGEDGDKFKLDELMEAEAQLLGRVTYEAFASAWPTIEDDGVILVAGSAQLAQGLIEHDLVDEIRLMTFPVVLGSGRRLFGDAEDKKRYTLSDVRSVGEGIAILTLQRP